MGAYEPVSLPGSGLAEEVLARYMVQAQDVEDKSGGKAVQAEVESLLHLVTFKLGKEEYGVDINSVQEIIRAVNITPVPGAPSHVCGVINLRGKIIPVIDLRRRFALPAVEANDLQRIVVAELGEKWIGVLVDSVSQVIKISSAAVDEMPGEATSVEHDFIRGVGKLDSRLIVVLDLKRSLLHRQ